MRLGLFAAVAAMGCGANDPAVGDVGPDCAALVSAARRANACDPTLEPLAAALERGADEATCRAAARRMLTPPAPGTPRVRSAFEREPEPPPDEPLTPDERSRLDALPMPAFLVITPDVAPAPGVASTAALIGALQLRADTEGRLRTGVAPGARSLRLEHAGQTAEYCVELKPCETLAATAHGAKLARHPAIKPGPC